MVRQAQSTILTTKQSNNALIQRVIRNEFVTASIKRFNDFGR